MTSTDRRGAAGRLRLTALAMTASLLAAACGGDVDQVAVTPPETAAPAGSSQSPTEPPPVEAPPVPGPEPAPPPGSEAPASTPLEPQAPSEPPAPPEPPEGGDSPEQVAPPQPPPESAAPPDPSEGGSPGLPEPPESPEAPQPSEPQERSEPRDDPSTTGDDASGVATAPPVGPVGSATDDSVDTAEPSAEPSAAPPPPDPPPPPPPTHPAPEPPTWYPVTVLVAKDDVNGIVPVYDAPNGNRLSFRDGELWSYTYRGNRLVLHVVDGIPGDEWVQAELPIRPNGARGWIRTADFNWSTVRHHILIDVSDRLVALFEGDELVTYTRAIVGTERTPTPALSGFIVEKLPNHDRRYGSDVVGDWILMLSFFSEALDSFSGGLPRIALHGTHIPDEVGTAQSNGCIRIPNNVIEFIARTAPLGTVVNITA